MKKNIRIASVLMMFAHSYLSAHCQMPCGIYHDNMVYDQIDQYIETMYKAMSEINSHEPVTPKDKNQFVRWVIEKEKESDAAADIFTKYFLQQKIKPSEDDTTAKVISAHKLLFQMVQIKQNTDRKLVFEFMEEWSKFKHMFHREGYECRIESEKLKKWQEEHEVMKSQDESAKSKDLKDSKDSKNTPDPKTIKDSKDVKKSEAH